MPRGLTRLGLALSVVIVAVSAYLHPMREGAMTRFNQFCNLAVVLWGIIVLIQEATK